MKVLTMVALLAAAMADSAKAMVLYGESYPVSTYHRTPDPYDAASAGHGRYGQSSYNYRSGHRDASDHNVAGGHDGHGSRSSHLYSHRNSRAYAQDKGTGYDNVYGYDKNTGHRGVIADYGSHQHKQGLHGRDVHHSSGSYGSVLRAVFGDHDEDGATAYGTEEPDSSGYGKYDVVLSKTPYYGPEHIYHYY